MKTLIVIALSLVASMSFAMPSVGDSASYNITQTMSGQTVSYSIAQTLTAYDGANAQYTVTQVVTYNTQSSTSTKTIPASKLLTDAQLSTYLAACASKGGTIEAVTVPAGTFNSCKVVSTDNGVTGSLNLGLVAFGIIRYESTDASGNHALLELTSSHINQ